MSLNIRQPDNPEASSYSFQATENLYNRLLERVNEIKCNCAHASEVGEYERSIARWNAILYCLRILLICLIMFAFLFGFSCGITYLRLSTSSGCNFDSIIWNKPCDVAY